MIKKPVTQSEHKWKAIAISCTVAVVLLCSGGMIVSLSISSAQDEFLSMTKMPEGIEPEAMLETADSVRALVRHAQNFSAPEEFVKHPNDGYRIKTTLKTPDGEYRDIVWSVDRKNASLHVLADGFTREERISLSLGNDDFYRDIPMDWSGRIELEVSLPAEKTVNACVEVNGRDGVIGLCHQVPERRRA